LRCIATSTTREEQLYAYSNPKLEKGLLVNSKMFSKPQRTTFGSKPPAIEIE
jgi:hypothetical protein